MESQQPFQLTLPLERRARLLIVEDDDDTRTLLSQFFLTKGYGVVEAQNGRQALDLAKRDHELDIVLLDVFVPEVGGIEVLWQVRYIAPQAGVILMTALGDRMIAQHALRLGAFDCLQKPLDLAQLEATVVACLGHSEYRKQSWWRRLIADPAA
ncbi:MAG: response regulator [Acidobacteria bacterium]|nr:response regulator [Acidobacteriota bacterium]